MPVNEATTYNKLLVELKRIYLLGGALGLMHWDEQVNLPKGSSSQRAEQLSALADLVHRESTLPQMGQWIEELENNTVQFSNQELAVLKEARRNYDRMTKLPAEFVARKSALDSKAYHAWAEAREKNNFSLFAPLLKQQVNSAIEEAQYIGYTRENAYDYHIDNHDPGLNADIINKLFNALKKDLIPLVQKILKSSTRADTSILREFPRELQEDFLREVTAALGFDYDHGRIDQALHPFCGGDGSDTRMTTRYEANNPLSSLFSSIHETGHGMYEQGLPSAHLGTALGSAVGMAVHESQSRLWENQVGRSRSFWEYWEPKYRKLFPGQLAKISREQFYLTLNAVALNPIRVDSDEVTYNLHIILRFELEKRLFSGDLTIEDLPAEWNRLSLEIVGLKPRSDSEGVLQDIHWSSGSFGYFPSYCLGNMLAAQLWFAVRKAQPGLEEDFLRGDFSTLLNWLRINIHGHGKQYDTLTLTQMVTGEALSPKSLIKYLEERYLPLYL